jgi:DNA-binding NtrC family response regulator
VQPLTPDLEWLAGPLAAGETVVDSPPIRDLEVQYIRELLARYEGHRRRVAERMGISERTLYRKLKRYGIA